MQHQIGITANRRSEVSVVALRKTEVTDRSGIINCPPHTAQHQGVGMITQGMIDNRVQKLGQIFRIGQVPSFEAQHGQIGLQFL